MSNERRSHANSLVVVGIALGMGLALPASAQTVLDQGTPRQTSGAMTASGQGAAARPTSSTKKRVEFEVHGGLGGGGSASGGTGALPAAGATFITILGTPSRRVPSWYFGDGTKLFNDFNTSITFSTNHITPLDPVLNASATSRKRGVALGVRLGFPLSDRMVLEASVDVVRSRLAIGSDALNTIEQSRSTFKSTFTAGLTGAPGLAVTSTSTIVDTQGQQVFATGGLRVNLLARGTVMPFVTVGGGLVHGTGIDTVRMVGNYQFLSCGGACPKNETDTVNVSYNGSGNSPLLEFGAGIKGDLSKRGGWRIDGRVWMSKSLNTTVVSASPVVAPAAPSVQSVLAFGGSPDLQVSTVSGFNSSLSGSTDSFQSFTGTGRRMQVSLTAGYVFRF